MLTFLHEMTGRSMVVVSQQRNKKAALLLLVAHAVWTTTSPHSGQVLAFTAFTPATQRQQGRHNNLHHPSMKKSSRLMAFYPPVANDTLIDAVLEQVVVDEPFHVHSPETGRFLSEAHVLAQAALLGTCSGAAIGLFKLSIETVRHVFYGHALAAPMLPFIPAFGGLIVAMLSLPGAFPPGLIGTVKEVDKDSRRAARGMLKTVRRPFGALRKSIASVFTLGTGSSLGPEGPSVEIGMAMSRSFMDAFPSFDNIWNTNVESEIPPNKDEILQRNRLLLQCGAAAGVSAGFNAPLAGVFFALEIVEGTFAAVAPNSEAKPADTPADITAILLASVLSAFASRAILGDHIIFQVPEYTLQTPLVELPLYLLLGATSGFVASAFGELTKLAKSLFDGKIGPEGLRDAITSLPSGLKPIIGGLLCGVIGLAFPQILFFGYETLNPLLGKISLPTLTLLSLLVVKAVATALAAGSGLVGGTFAPALFLGAMTGASFHNIMESLFQHVSPMDGYAHAVQLADIPAYAMVGAASTLAALFRAPLTASLLMFELTRDYDVILPLMVSAGIGSVVGGIFESKLERERMEELEARSVPVLVTTPFINSTDTKPE